MKKRIWILCIAIVLLLVGLCAAFLMGKNITVGRCVVAANGRFLLIDGSSPIAMSDRAWGAPFKNLSTGDRILVVHDGVAESYPAQTGVYLCIKLSDGTQDDISRDVLSSLQELGWLPQADE